MKQLPMLTRRSVILAASSALLQGEAWSSPPGRQRQRAALTKLLTMRPQNSAMLSAPSPATTFSSLYNLESPPTWVRLVYANDLHDPESIDGAAIACTAAVGDGFTPCNGDGKPDPSQWRRVTFAAKGFDSAPGAKSDGPVLTLDVAGDASWGRNPPSLLFSDWLHMKPPQRSDGLSGYLLLVRTYSGGKFRNNAIRFYKAAGPDIGRVYAGFSSPGNGATAPWRFKGEPADIPAAYAVQYLSATPGATVIGIGDSIQQPPLEIGIGMRACALASTPQLPLTFANQTRIGAPTSVFLPLGARDIEALRPQIMLLQMWSSNDPNITEATTDAVFEQAMNLIALGRKHGCVPILLTAPPVRNTPNLEPYRQRSNERVRGAASQGIGLLDLDKLWGTGATPNVFREGYTRDNVHGTDKACIAAAEALRPLFRAILTAV